MTGALPDGTVAFLLTDVEGSTVRWEAEPDAMAVAVDRHYEILAAAVSAHGGHRPVEQGEGDSVVAAFAQASEAVAAAVAAQQALGEEAWTTSRPLRVRMAIHLGEARLRDDATYMGQTIIRTARLRAIAHGGQVVVSAAVRDLVSDALPDGVGLRDLGTHRLKDLRRAERVFQVVAPDLQARFPALLSVDAVPNNLPASLSSFIGRQAEVAAVADLVEHNRVVTVTGIGGAGKTRLAQQIAAEVVDGFPGGVWWVPLARVDDPAQVGEALAEAAATPPGGSPAAVRLARHLGDRRALMVVDNCEHVALAVADVLLDVLTACPEAVVLATSRSPLDLPGEVTWRIPPLALPSERPADDSMREVESDAMALLVERVRQARPDRPLSPDDLDAAEAICRTLDGLPLALELVAVRARTSSLPRVAEGLGDILPGLGVGPRGTLPQQRTMEASLAWSHDLLTVQEQVAFRRLAAFRGGFDLDGARTVLGVDPIDAADVERLVEGLVDHSLVQVDDGEVDGRFRMLEVVRQFAATCLAGSGEEEAVRSRHAVYVHDVVVAASPGRLSPEMAVGAERLSIDHDNLEAAVMWLTEHDPRRAVAVVVALHDYLLWRGRSLQGVEWLDRLLEVDLDRGSRTEGLIVRAGLRQIHGDVLGAVMDADEAHRLALDAGEELAAARAQWVRASLVAMIDPSGALPDLLRVVEVADGQGHEEVAILALAAILSCQLMRSRLEETARLSDAIDRRLGDRGLVLPLPAQTWIAIHHLQRGEHDLALAGVDASDRYGGPHVNLGLRAMGACVRALVHSDRGERPDVAPLRRSLDWSREDGHVVAVIFSLLGLAMTAHADGDLSAALATFEEMATVSSAVGAPFGVAFGTLGAADVAHALGDRDGARSWLERSVAATDALDSPQHRAHAARRRAALIIDVGDFPAAEADGRAALAGELENGILRDATFSLDVLVTVLAAAGRWEEVGLALGAADAHRAATGIVVRLAPEAERVAIAEAEALDRLGAAAFGAVREQGVALGPGGLLAVLESRSDARGPSPSLRPVAGWGSLTPAEQRVADLVARGLSNREVADDLVVSVETVKSHVSHILRKVGLRSRTELAAQHPGADDSRAG